MKARFVLLAMMVTLLPAAALAGSLPARDAAPSDPNPDVARIARLKAEVVQNGYGDLLDELEKEWGQRPMRSIGYLPKMGGEVAKAIFTGSANTGVSPTLLSVAMFQEGFNLFLEKHPNAEDPRNLPVDGFDDVGADAFLDRMPELKRRGYLPKGWNGATPKSVLGCVDDACNQAGFTAVWRNERGEKFHAYDFNSMRDAATGMAAMLAFERDRMLADAKRLHVDVAKMPQAERDAWTYVYYNAGDAVGRKLLKRTGGKLPRKPAKGKAGEINSNPFYNAQRVAASIAMHQRLGVFDGVNVSRYADTRGAAKPGAGSRAAATANDGFHH